MIEGLAIKLIIGLVGCGGFGIFLYQKGKKAERNEQMEGMISEARKSNHRQANRRNDSINAVRHRMQKNVRK